ncbi:MAG: transposase [Acidimicrobiia bacterium]|nr:transposase [Acidimicrobiia bacterium]
MWYVPEERGFELKLVNARHVKILPRRKSDVLDAEWLAELLEHGLLRGSFVPPAAIRELRDLTRYRKRLVQTHTSECRRIQEILEDAGIKLDSVGSDVLGVSGRASHHQGRRVAPRRPRSMRVGRSAHPGHLPLIPVLATRPQDRQEEGRHRGRPLDPDDQLAPPHQRHRRAHPDHQRDRAIQQLHDLGYQVTLNKVA